MAAGEGLDEGLAGGLRQDLGEDLLEVVDGGALLRWLLRNYSVRTLAERTGVTSGR